MGHWGVKSYEHDDAADALDAALARVHGAVYDDLMDDRNPLTPDQVHKQLAGPETLAAAVAVLQEAFGDDVEAWDEVDRLAFVGVVVRHAELGVSIPDDWRRRAIDWLEHEAIDWDEATVRRLRRQQEIDLLRRASPHEDGGPRASAPGGVEL
jgi:hypothetical protein